MMLFQITIAYSAGRGMGLARSLGTRKIYAGTALLLLLGTLLFFKYLKFFVSSIENILNISGQEMFFRQFQLNMPVGLSFYTFMCIAYVLDIYRNKISAENNCLKVGTFAVFFPHAASGPIDRASSLLPQLAQPSVFQTENLIIGFRLILWGIVKKVVIADRLAIFVNSVFSDPTHYSGCTCWVAMYFFAIQIYCDFSGYSDIAIGSAKLFGIQLMQNFNLPYFAESIHEFWKRWHISLTSWFRDYLYIPLGGNRVRTVRWLANIMIVFLVSGLWHGAAWTFVVWGGLHGVAYLTELGMRKISEKYFHLLFFSQMQSFLRPVRIILTFHIVAVAWVFFRAPSFSHARCFFQSVLTSWGAFQWGTTKIPVMISFGLIFFLLIAELLILCGWSGDYLHKGRCPFWLSCIGYGGLLIMLSLLGVHSDNFIYLQF